MNTGAWVVIGVVAVAAVAAWVGLMARRRRAAVGGDDGGAQTADQKLAAARRAIRQSARTQRRQFASQRAEFRAPASTPKPDEDLDDSDEE
jgi:hypothetical protein